MNYKNIVLYTLVSGCTLVWSSCGGHDHDAHGHNHDGHDHEDEIVAEHEHKHGADEIVFEPEQAKRFGVLVDTVFPGDFSETVKVTGAIVLNPTNRLNAVARSAGVLKYAAGVVPGMKVAAGQTIATVSADGMAGGDANAVSAAEVAAARRELDRLQPLYEAGVVSLKELNAAKATYDKARSASSGSGNGSVVTAMKSGVITSLDAVQGGYVNAGDVVVQISAGDDMVLRADLPQKYGIVAQRFTDANFRLASSDSIYAIADFGGRRVSAVPVSSPAIPGYVPVYFVLDGDGRLLSDTFAEVYLRGDVRHNVMTIPVDAVTEEQGHHFVFVKKSDHGYVKCPVSLGQTDGVDIEVTDGLHPGDVVVTRGAIFIRLAQSSDVVPEGHSHNH